MVKITQLCELSVRNKVSNRFILEHQKRKGVNILEGLAGGLGKLTQLLYGKEFHYSERLQLFG